MLIATFKKTIHGNGFDFLEDKKYKAIDGNDLDEPKEIWLVRQPDGSGEDHYCSFQKDSTTNVFTISEINDNDAIKECVTGENPFSQEQKNALRFLKRALNQNKEVFRNFNTDTEDTPEGFTDLMEKIEDLSEDILDYI